MLFTVRQPEHFRPPLRRPLCFRFFMGSSPTGLVRFREILPFSIGYRMRSVPSLHLIFALAGDPCFKGIAVLFHRRTRLIGCVAGGSFAFGYFQPIKRPMRRSPYCGCARYRIQAGVRQDPWAWGVPAFDGNTQIVRQKRSPPGFNRINRLRTAGLTCGSSQGRFARYLGNYADFGAHKMS